MSFPFFTDVFSSLGSRFGDRTKAHSQKKLQHNLVAPRVPLQSSVFSLELKIRNIKTFLAIDKKQKNLCFFSVNSCISCFRGIK